MKKLFLFAIMSVVTLPAVSCKETKKEYESVAGDPINARIYTLDNGLKVYMAVNKEEPRIQTYIAVRAGSKNDPAETTGLAHYFEHLMFKGTPSFGTSDYEAEKPMLDQIEQLFEVYRQTTDSVERKAIYHQIDSVSFAASQISIPNEYDKLMAAIGAQGTNAFTSNDVTCYTEDIPSNQIENWAKVQSDRFKNLVIRGFHTELEAVYEEYNMYLNEDTENAMMAIDSVLFAKHPYGLQSTIGTSEHLKNPSIAAIKRQKATYYVPNNIAICAAGDFDPDEFVAIIEKYFGDWQPNEDLPVLTYEEEDPIEAPVVKDVYGTDAEFVMVGWRYPGQKEISSEMGDMVGEILQNGQAGLFDLDIIQQQKLLAAQAMPYARVDYGEMLLMAYPKEGQTLEEAKDVLLEEIAKLRSGDFDEEMIQAVVANHKLRQMRSLENNRSRVSLFLDSFIAGHDWADDVHQLDRFAKLTKQDIVDWANTYLGDNNYVVAYKHNGPNPKNEKIVAPAITPIATNRDKTSAFLAEIQNDVVAPIEPSFVDFSKDMSVFDQQDGIEVLYKHNDVNDIATITFNFDYGTINDPAIRLAFDYLSYLGTSEISAEELASEEYKLACSHRFSASASQSVYSVTGLSENLPRALELVEDLIANAQPDEEILAGLKQDEIKSRSVTKFNQNACGSALRNYLMFPDFVKNAYLSNDEVLALTSEELLSKVSNILTYAHKVLYYGPQSESEVKNLLSEYHNVASELVPLVKTKILPALTPESKVIVAPYDQRQFNYIQFSNRGEQYQLEDAPQIALYNEYFGGGMNTIVFQEMREARALAYSAGARLSAPSYKDGNYAFYATIGSQNDKLQQAVEAFDEIINDMPQSEKSMDIAHVALETSLRTQRTIGANVLNSYIRDEELGLTEPAAKYVFEHLDDLSMEAVVACQQKWVKDRTYVYGILGDPKDLDMNYLKTLGPVEVVTLEDIFGY